jgi:hypothetical protein
MSQVIRNISVITKFVPTNFHCWYNCYEIDILKYCSEFPEYPLPYKFKNVPKKLISFFVLVHGYLTLILVYTTIFYGKIVLDFHVAQKSPAHPIFERVAISYLFLCLPFPLEHYIRFPCWSYAYRISCYSPLGFHDAFTHFYVILKIY